MFEWDEYNEEHIDRHGVSIDEAEEAVFDPRRLGAPAHDVQGEKRWAFLGATLDGRILVIVFTRHDDVVRVVTARDATDRERRRYRERGK